MKFKGKIYFFLLLTLLSHLLVFYLKNFVPATRAVDGVEQETFLQYTFYLRSGGIPESIGLFHTRLFPGVPILVYLISFLTIEPIKIAILFILIFLSVLYLLVYRLTQDAFFSFWISVFPPVVFELTSKISTETITIILILLIYLLYFKYKKFLLSFFLTGYSFLVRPVGAMLVVPLLICQLKEKRSISNLLRSVGAFATIPFLLIIYNLHYFDRPLYQLYAYENTIGSTFIIPFVLQNWRDWYVQGQYQVLGSFIIYTITAFALMWAVLRNKGDFLFKNDSNFVKIWVVLTLVFILGIGPREFIAAGGRFYSVLYAPSFVFLYNKFKEHKFILYLLLPTVYFAFI